MSTSTDIRPEVGDPALDQGEPTEAHYVKKGQITDAYVFGEPLTALCGKVFVPTRNPERYPVCEMCKELREMVDPPKPGGQS